MGQKIHRRRRHRRTGNTQIPPFVGWIAAAVVLIPASFFAAKWIATRPADTPTVTPPQNTPTTAMTETVTTTTAPVLPAGEQIWRGVILSVDALRDTAALKKTAESAAGAGFNCMAVELKTKAGELKYITQTSLGVKAAAFSADALPLDALKNAFATLQKAGITPIIKLYAFEDATAPRTLPEAKVTTTGHNDWTWYDGDPKNGGKPWLNPYTATACDYIAALAEELYAAGAGVIQLDGAYFPTQTMQADFTAGGDASLTKAQVLGNFITRMEALSDKPLWLSAGVNAALGNNPAGFTANPCTFGADFINPDLTLTSLGTRVSVNGTMLPVSTDTLADVVTQTVGAIAAGNNPTPTVPTIDPNKAVMDALKTANDKASFMLYDQNFTYNFTALS